MFEIEDFRTHELGSILRDYYEKSRLCDACAAAKVAENRAMLENSRLDLRRQLLPREIAAAQIPESYYCERGSAHPFTEPPCRFAAEWIWRNRQQNLLISGVTGSGKSTSACFVAVRLIEEGKRVLYTTLRRLLEQWREAKTGNSRHSAESFLTELRGLDVLIIDEVVGKARVSESGQELLFELLEGVNNGESHARLWWLGNFYAGSIEMLFADSQPVRRRLHDNFSCVLLDAEHARIHPLPVWENAKR